MSNALSEYFANEITGWLESMEFYEEQIEQSSTWLNMIINYNTVPMLASSVQHFLLKFDDFSARFESLKTDCKKFQSELVVDDDYKEDYFLTEENLLTHRDFRDKVKRTELEYLELKYAVDEFVADTLFVQKQKPYSGN
jgi:NifB/MoaA-like Fe-S oxidoreductase